MTIVRRIAALSALDAPLDEIVDSVRTIICDHFEVGSCSVVANTDPRSTEDPLVFSAISSGETKVSESAIAIPMRVGTTVVGALFIEQPVRRFSADDIGTLEACALYVALRLREARLEEIALIDALTGVANRRGFDERLTAEWRRTMRAAGSLSLILVDIDFFKAYNDRYGHLQGDTALRRVAQTLAVCLGRSSDLIARFGGEEFAAILPEIDHEGAIAVAERMRAAVDALAIPHSDSGAGTVTLSVGVATMIPSGDTEPSTLIAAADAAMYDAKHRGRHRVAALDYRSVAPAVERRGDARTIPQPLTTFLGRERERAECASLLAGRRLVTLCGPGGVGKTRLALRVASDIERTLRDGVAFVDLAALNEPNEILFAFAAATRMRHDAAQALDAMVLRELGDREILMILDNCEHLIEAAALTAEWVLQHCPGVRILVTSREPLCVNGETVMRMNALPDGDASALFVDRARLVRPEAHFDEEARSDIAGICRRLDNLPLAIELAAARTRTMPVQTIRRRLDDRFGLLVDGSRTALPRQRTLAGLIAWSYDLLDEGERRMLRRTSVFAGTWTLESASRIGLDSGENRNAAFARLAALADKSLIAVVSKDDEERFVHYESIRAYALDRLRDAGEEDLAARRLAEEIGELGMRYDRGDVSSGLRTEEDNVRAALRWCLVEARDPSLGQQIAADLVRYWRDSGVYSEGRSWIVRALEHPSPPSQTTRLELGLAIMDLEAGRFDEAMPLAQRAVASAEAAGEGLARLFARNAVALIALGSGRHAAAHGMFSENLRDARAQQSELLEAYSVGNLGIIESECRGNFEQAKEHYSEALDIFDRLGNAGNSAVILAYLGELAWHQHRLDDAIAYGQRALSVYAKYDNESKVAEQRGRIAIYAIALGDLATAQAHLAPAVDELGSMLTPRANGYILFALAQYALAVGRAEVAAALCGAAQRWGSVVSFVPYPLVDRHIRAINREIRGQIGDVAWRRERKRGYGASSSGIAALVTSLDAGGIMSASLRSARVREASSMVDQRKDPREHQLR